MFSGNPLKDWLEIVGVTLYLLHSHFVWLRLPVSSIAKFPSLFLSDSRWEFLRWMPGSVNFYR